MKEIQRESLMSIQLDEEEEDVSKIKLLKINHIS